MPQLIKRWEGSTTATVGELIAKLSEFPQEMGVAYTWEGQVLPVVLEKIEVMEDTDKVCGPVLLLDAET